MNIRRLRTESEVRGLIQRLNKANSPAALDIETTGLDPRKDQLLTIVLSDSEPQSACTIPAQFARFLQDLTCPLVLHNYKFDYTFLYRKGIDILDKECRDTMLLHHLWDENKSHALDDIVKEFFQTSYKEEFWSKYENFQDAPESEQDDYAGRDVIYTLKVYKILQCYLESDGLPQDLIRMIHDFSYHLLKTELSGICIDVQAITVKGLECKKKILNLRDDMRKAALEAVESVEAHLWTKEKGKRKSDTGKAAVVKPEFNFNSSSQLKMLLYDVLKLPEQRSVQKKVTTDDSALVALNDLHPIIPLLRDYKEQEKIFTAFLEGALDRSIDGRIYPSFNINGTVTGRISSSNPNMQQLPASGGIRGIYVPDKGRKFISADYKQLEVTLAAHFSLDPSLLRVVNEGVSLHDITAQGLGIDRKLAKTVNFAVQYGAGAKKIQKILKCSEDEAKVALSRYWDTYPGLKKLIDECHECVDANIPIGNPFGRQRHLKVQNPRDKWEVASVKRQAFNSLIQGTGADITNTAFLRISEDLMKSGQGTGLFVVHDEILIEVDEKRVVYWEHELVKIMENVGREIKLRVPLKADSSGGMDRWED